MDAAVLVADRDDPGAGLGRNRAACEPTLPKPCTAARRLVRAMPACARAARATCTTPRDVAVDRPSEPPMLTGLPVVDAGDGVALLTEYVSMIQAMVCSSVPMSGARMSCSGPMIGMISLV